MTPDQTSKPKFYAGLHDSRKNTSVGNYVITAWNAWRRNGKRLHYLPQGCSIIIDCGAYGAYTAGVPLPFSVEEYVGFVKMAQDKTTVDAVATMDVINDRRASEDNAKSISEAYPFIPWLMTAHGETDAECAESAAYLATLNPTLIGIGCATLARSGGVKAIMSRVEAVACAAPNHKLHLWGVGLKRAEALKHPAVASHDSSAWYPRTSDKMTRDELETWQGSTVDFVEYKLKEYRLKLEVKLSG